MTARRRILLLCLIMAAACAAAAGSSIWELYRAAMKRERERLTAAARAEARLIEQSSRREGRGSLASPVGGPSAGAFDPAIGHSPDARGRYEVFGETGELTLARREGDSIVYLFRHGRRGVSAPESVPFESNLAEPMRRALSGLSGTTVARDDSGNPVLAAYEPVSNLGIGIVAKIDLREVRLPFIRACMLALVITSLVIAAGVFLFFRISNPMIEKLESHGRYLEREIETRRQAGERLAHLNAVLRGIRRVNQLITQEGDRGRLLEGSCANLVETLGYRHAWLAIFDEEKRLIAVAASGFSGSFPLLAERMNGAELPACARRALAQSGAVVSESRGECGSCPLVNSYPDRAAITVRVEQGETIYGVLSASIPAAYASDAEDRDLIEEIAGDIAFALYKIELVKAHRKAEREAREAREFAESIVETIREPLVVLDPNLRVVSASRSFYQTFGVTPKETEGNLIFDLGDRQWNIPGLRGLLKDILPNNCSFSDFEVEHDFPSLGKRVMLLNARRLRRGDEKKQLILLAVEDITEQKSLEEQVRHIQKMEAIGTLAGGLAHDFNNILAGVLGYAALLKREVTGRKELEDLETIERLAWRGSGIAKSLLSFARRGECSTESLDLTVIADEVIKIIQQTAGNAVSIKKKFAPSISHIVGDRGQLYQAVMNLCINACEAMPSGGTLTVRLANTLPDDRFFMRHPVLRRGSYIRAEISDTGVGMDDETRRRIFEPFFTTKAFKSGTGLGLSVVAGIIERHGGCIEVESEPGSGSGVLEKIRETCRDTPVIVYTGSPSGILADRILRERAADILQKPFSFRELARKIREAMENG